MRKLSAILLLFVLLLSTLAVSISCDNDSAESSSNPIIETVNEYFDALEGDDFTKIMECMDPASISDEESLEGETAFQIAGGLHLYISINNRDFSVIAETEDSAMVSAKFDAELTLKGPLGSSSKTESVQEILHLVKVDDRWLLTEFPKVHND